MSISEQITRIQNEVTTQESLIKQIVAALESKAAPTPGTDTSDATATAGDILIGKTAYVNGEKIIGTYIVPEPEEFIFKIKGESYTAKVGMTWEEYVNTIAPEWHIGSNNNITDSVSWIGYLNYNKHDTAYPIPVQKTDYIWSGYDYTHGFSGGTND